VQRRTAGLFAAGLAVGAALEYFADPRSGRRRRHDLVSWSGGLVRHGLRRAVRGARGVAADAYGLTQHLLHLRERPKDYDDVTLAHKVETVLFRDRDVPKGQINVNAENGVVYLRGEAPTAELIEELVERARRIQGVREVESLLHLPQG
jgi:osmotically-inducible protein OsmY